LLYFLPSFQIYFSQLCFPYFSVLWYHFVINFYAVNIYSSLAAWYFIFHLASHILLYTLFYFRYI
jgi:hypothetical protein